MEVIANPPTRLAVLMTCHNRREKTLACLGHLEAQEDLPPGLTLDVYLTDDGSTDGTSGAVNRQFPSVRILHGDGSLYWSQGMRVAWAAAMEHDYDYYLWLNDDTLLHPTALSTLLGTYARLSASRRQLSIVAGSTKDPISHETTYGGVVRSSRWHPLKYELVKPSSAEASACTTVNGNCVLVPRAVAVAVGNLDNRFTHGMGDFDYALRAADKGASCWVAPRHVGTCSRNDDAGTWREAGIGLRRRWKRLNSPKGLPLREWLEYTRRHAGPFWPVFWLGPYISAAARTIAPRTRGKHT